MFNIVSCKYYIFSVCYTIRMYIKVCIHVWVCILKSDDIPEGEVWSVNR